MESSEDSTHREMATIDYGTANRGIKAISQEKDKWIVCEVIALIVTIGIAWMLLLLPIIFYHLPDDVFTTENVSVLN